MDFGTPFPLPSGENTFGLEWATSTKPQINQLLTTSDHRAQLFDADNSRCVHVLSTRHAGNERFTAPATYAPSTRTTYGTTNFNEGSLAVAWTESVRQIGKAHSVEVISNPQRIFPLDDGRTCVIQSLNGGLGMFTEDLHRKVWESMELLATPASRRVVWSTVLSTMVQPGRSERHRVLAVHIASVVQQGDEWLYTVQQAGIPLRIEGKGDAPVPKSESLEGWAIEVGAGGTKRGQASSFTLVEHRLIKKTTEVAKEKGAGAGSTPVIVSAGLLKEQRILAVAWSDNTVELRSFGAAPLEAPKEVKGSAVASTEKHKAAAVASSFWYSGYPGVSSDLSVQPDSDAGDGSALTVVSTHLLTLEPHGLLVLQYLQPSDSSAPTVKVSGWDARFVVPLGSTTIDLSLWAAEAEHQDVRLIAAASKDNTLVALSLCATGKAAGGRGKAAPSGCVVLPVTLRASSLASAVASGARGSSTWVEEEDINGPRSRGVEGADTLMEALTQLKNAGSSSDSVDYASSLATPDLSKCIEALLGKSNDTALEAGDASAKRQRVDGSRFISFEQKAKEDWSKGIVAQAKVAVPAIEHFMSLCGIDGKPAKSARSISKALGMVSQPVIDALFVSCMNTLSSKDSKAASMRSSVESLLLTIMENRRLCASPVPNFIEVLLEQHQLVLLEAALIYVPDIRERDLVAIVNYLADGLTAEGLRRQPPKYLMTNRTVPKYGKQAKWNLKSMPDNALLSRGVLYFGALLVQAHRNDVFLEKHLSRLPIATVVMLISTLLALFRRTERLSPKALLSPAVAENLDTATQALAKAHNAYSAAEALKGREGGRERKKNAMAALAASGEIVQAMATLAQAPRRQRNPNAIPIPGQILDWLRLVVDAHFSSLKLVAAKNESVKSVLRLLQDAVHTDVDVCSCAAGVREHLYDMMRRVRLPQPPAPSYREEVIDI